MNSFKEKYGSYALITGGTSGIGRAIAGELAKKKLNIVLVARGKDELKKSAQQLSAQYGVDVKTIIADLGVHEGIDAVKNGTIGVEVGMFITAAGYETNGLFTKIDLQKELAVVNINVIATLELAHHFAQKMVERKRGGLLFVCSLSGHMPNPYLSNYAASKAYVLNFGLSLRGELNLHGIDVSVLSPGLTNTPMAKTTGIDWNKTPLKKMEAEKVAEIAIRDFGKKAVIVPGGRNKVMSFMAKYLTPLSIGSVMGEKMMRNAISQDRL